MSGAVLCTTGFLAHSFFVETTINSIAYMDFLQNFLFPQIEQIENSKMEHRVTSQIMSEKRWIIDFQTEVLAEIDPSHGQLEVRI